MYSKKHSFTLLDETETKSNNTTGPQVEDHAVFFSNINLLFSMLLLTY